MIRSVAGTQPIMAAIRHAAAKTNNSFDAMLATASAESSLNPEARAKTSSATGLFQFTKATWLSVVKRYGKEAGIDPKMPESKLLALRKDPAMASMMAGYLANDNRAHLEQKLGRPVSNEEVYVAHFMGASAAARLLNSAEAKPSVSAAQLFPRHAASNRTIFFAGPRARTVAEVADLLANKVDVNATALADARPGSLAQAGDISMDDAAGPARTTPTRLGNWVEGDTDGFRLMRINLARKLLQEEPRAPA